MKENETQEKIMNGGHSAFTIAEGAVFLTNKALFNSKKRGEKSKKTKRQHLISQETIDAINKISPETLLAHGALKKARIGYICPLCGNGKGKDGTGITPLVTNSHVGWKCHRCNEKFNNMDFLARHYGLNKTANFRELCESICADFNIPLEYDAPLGNKATEKKSAVPPAELIAINDDLNSDIQSLKDFVAVQDGGLWRGLPLEILEKFGCRYISNWTPPKSRAAQKFSTPTPRMIIPANADGLHSNYLARLTVPKNSFDETAQKYIAEKQHAGKKSLFNPDALTADTVFAVEGYIDALSIEFAGFKAVAVGGADAYQLLVDAVAALQKKPFVIILFDPDATGKRLAPKLQSSLKKIGCQAVIRFLSSDDCKLDCNQILQEQGADFLTNKLDDIQNESAAEFETVENTSNKVIHATDPTDDDADRKNRTSDMIKDCPVDLILPDNYLFRRGGITLVVPPKKDGDDPKYICVARTPIIPTKIFREPTKSKFSYEIAILTRKVWRTVEIDGRTLADPRAIIALADTGALILEPKLTCRFLVDVIALNPDLQEIKAYNQTGWTDDTFKTFAYPHSKEHIIRRAGFDFDRDLAKRGDADLWKEKFIEVTKKGGAVAAMYIGTALASVLARPLNIMNPQTHLNGTSGGGKTALQKFTASIFGNPRKLIRTFAATNKNRQLVSAAFCDLPTFYDELETIQGKAAEEQLSNDIYNFAEGKGNQANKRDGTARETFEFGGARLTTGERPLLKNHDLRGAYKRLIQLDTGKGLFSDVFAADLHIFSESNFGHFGDEWTKYVTEHLEEIQKEYRHYSTSYNPILKIFEPTHLKSVTAALIAFEFFKVMLGINAKFDEDCAFIRNRRAIVDTLPTTADLDDKKRALNSLSSWIASHEKTFTRDETDTDTNKPIEIGAWGTTCSGKIFDTGAVAIFPTELRRIIEDELHFASADKLINEWILDGTLETDNGRKNKVIKIGKKTYRVYYFKAGTISTSNDSAESNYYEKLSEGD